MARIDVFPCIFRASREFSPSETGSLLTAPSTGESANHRSLNIGRGSAPTRREGPISYDDRDRERATRQALALDTVAFVHRRESPGLSPSRRAAPQKSR